MFRKSKGKKDKTAYGVIGLGRFGEALARELAAAGADLMVIDRSEEKVREMRELTENALVVQSLDKNTLLDTGIQNCDVVIVCVGSQMDTSILTTLHLVSMGVPKVIAKASSAEHGEILEKLGAEIVYPERDMAVRLANRLENAGVLDYIRLSERINITKLQAPGEIIGKTVVEANLRARFGLNIIAVENNGEVIETILPGYVFRPGDILFLSGGKDGQQRLAEWLETGE